MCVRACACVCVCVCDVYVCVCVCVCVRRGPVRWGQHCCGVSVCWQRARELQLLLLTAWNSTRYREWNPFLPSHDHSDIALVLFTCIEEPECLVSKGLTADEGHC